MKGAIALELKHVTKRFGSVIANKDVSLNVHHGEILAVLGENGSGKTTLMNMISGIYFPDEGEIYVDGERAHIAAPKDAFKYGIGMIHQHFKLVDVFTATENIILGIEGEKKFKLKESAARIAEERMEPTKLSRRSLPRPATSPTLSPTLSAMVAGLRGSSSGM